MTRRFIPSVPTLPDGYSSYNKYTSGVFHAYADSSRPDDSGDGLSWATAKKTLEAAAAILPDVSEDHVVLHLKGSFTIASTVLIGIRISGGTNRLLIDGGDDVIVVDGPYTATASTTTSLTDSNRTWTANALQGYTVEILDGPAVGYQYTIQSNTVDTIVVGKTWPVPGTAQYRIVKPATVISSAGYKYLQVTGKVDYRVTFQRLRLDGTMSLGLAVSANAQYCEFANIIFEPTAAGYIFASGPTGLICHYFLADPDAPGSNMHTSGQRMGVAYLGSYSYAISASFSSAISLYGLSVFKKPIKLVAIPSCRLSNGVLATGVISQNSNLELGYSTSYGESALLDSASGIGVQCLDSRLSVSKDFAIQNCGSHAIQLDSSTLECQDAVLSGSGNGGAGVYLKNRSSVLIKNGYTPTLTGSVGDITFTGSSNDGTWSEVDNNTPVVDLKTLSNVQEVL